MTNSIKHVLHIGESGKLIRPTCEHDLIAGLDASYCSDCETWWIDGQETKKFYDRKKRGLNHS